MRMTGKNSQATPQNHVPYAYTSIFPRTGESVEYQNLIRKIRLNES